MWHVLFTTHVLSSPSMTWHVSHIIFFFCIDTNSAFLILELQNNESTVSSQFPEKSQGWRWRLLMMRI